MHYRELYNMLLGQIRDHDAVLEAMRALARATLAVSAVVLGIMIISLGNLVIFIHGSYPHGIPLQAATVIIALTVMGLGGIMAAVVLSVRAVSVSRVRQPISYRDFGEGARHVLENMRSATDDEVYGNLAETCVAALKDRETAIGTVGFRTSWAQVFLLAGLLASGAGITIALVLVLTSVGSG